MDIREDLERARRELLDLSTRNRLLSCPARNRSGLDIVDELCDEIYRILVTDSRSMSFLAGSGDPEESEGDSVEWTPEARPRNKGRVAVE